MMNEFQSHQDEFQQIKSAYQMRGGNQDFKKNTVAIDSLNQLLANEFSLFTKTLNFHWNITGKSFHSLHVFLEDQYKDLLKLMDELAERVRVIGGRPLSTVKEFQEASEIEETPGEVPSATSMLKELLMVHYKIQMSIREILDQGEVFKSDWASEDMLVDILKKHELMAWMLKSHVIDESQSLS